MGPPQSKGETFPVDKMRRAGQLREEAGPCADYICLILEVRDLRNHICTESLFGGQRGMMSRDALLTVLCSRIHLH